jgi:O-antigen/teichoic acid export membrane protein
MDKLLSIKTEKSRLVKISKLIGTFILGQGSLQFIQVVTGFMLFRWLSIEEYGQYSMAFAFQSMAHVLVEFGFSGTIVALVGNRINDKKVIGGYIKAGESYRQKLFIVISIGCIVIFPFLTQKHHFSVITTVMLLLSIIVNLYFTGWSSYYVPPLKMHQRIGKLFEIQIKSSALRLAALYVTFMLSALNSWLAALLSSLQTFISGYLIKKASKEYIEIPDRINANDTKEMLALLKPVMPGIIFNAFQGQIMIFILSIFGKTNNVAEIGALSKMGQLYMVISMAGGMIIAPYIARSAAKGLLKKYMFISVSAVFICSLFVLTAYVFPQPFLFLLGEKYSYLGNELVLMLTTAGLGVVTGIVWEMNESRKWIYSWDPMIMISGTIGVQLVAVFFFDLSNLRNVLLLSIATNLLVLGIKIASSIKGFSKEI